MSDSKKANFFSLGPVLIVSAAVLWALDGVIRRSLFTLPPINIVYYEHLIGLVILAPFFLPWLLRTKLKARVWGLTAIIGLLSGVLGTLFFTTALLKVGFIAFSVVFLLQKLQPIFAVTAAKLILKEKVTHHYLKWAVLAFVAAYFVTFQNGVVNFDTGSGTVVAALFALGAAFAWGTSTVFSKLLLKEVNHTQATGLRFLATTIFALIGVFVLGSTVDFSAVTVSQWGRLVLISLSTGMVALWIYYKGLRKTEAKISTILELVFPLLAVIIDAVLYKTVLAPTQYFAAAVLMYAVYRVGRLQLKKA